MGLLYLNRDSTYNTRAELFSNNEQGLWLDPSQMSTLYQDSNGVTPCTDSGQPVGLILDQSRGGLGAFVNVADLSSGWSSADARWTYNASSVSWAGGGGANLVTSNLYLPTSYLNKYVRLTFTISGYSGSGTCGIENGVLSLVPSDIAGSNVITTLRSADGTYTLHGYWRGGGGVDGRTIQLLGRGTNSFTISNISVRELPGNHAYQTTSASRPTLARIPVSGRRNLLTRTEEFDNAAWTKVGGSVSANQIANPVNGELTADLLTEDSALSSHGFTFSYTAANVPYTASVYVKYDSHPFLEFGIDTLDVNAYAVFNITNGTVSSSGAGTVAAITSLGSGWYRCAVTYTPTAGAKTLRLRFGTDAITYFYTGNGTRKSYIWGAQLETGSTATNYQKVVATTDVTESGFGDLWHLVFDGSDDSLVTNSISFDTWTQETRRNLLVDTESFGASTWTRLNITAADNTTETTDPLGTNTSSKLTASSSTVRCAQNFTGRTAGENWVFSFYVKAGTATSVEYLVSNGLAESSNSSGTFTFSNQTFSGALGTYVTSRTATDVGDGWYRIVLICTIPAGQTAIRFNPALPTVNTATAYYWGAQAELATSVTTYQRVGTDEMTVIAGVRKLSDATTQMILESSANVGSNSGSFYLTAAELTGASGNFSFKTRGDVNPAAYANSGTILAPATRVISGLGDISSDVASIRINSTQTDYSADQGSGNFGNHILYIGRRGGTTLPYNGHLYQLIIRGRTTPTGKLLEAERFVARKTGVNL